MIRLKKLATVISLLGLIGVNSIAIANSKIDISAPKTITSKNSLTNLLVYINPVFYEHPVRMLHPYLDYWHMRGPMFEKVAIEVLNKSKFNNNKIGAKICKPNLNANITISLEPYIFYNPQMRIFHSEVIANVYGENLTLIATYKAKAQQQGELNNVAEYHLKLAYSKAMEGIVSLMLNDARKFNDIPTLNNNVCSMLNNVPTTRKYF